MMAEELERLGRAVSGVKVLAIVGCFKNSGKTSTLNYLVRLPQLSIRTLGILSIGYDGEERDFLQGIPKPRVNVREGWVLATAEATLRDSTAGLHVVRRTGIRTALGELLLARVNTPGTVVLAGIRHKQDLHWVVKGLFEAGADRVLVDGAYQRSMAADPSVSDGVVIALGPVPGLPGEKLRREVEKTIRRMLLRETDSAQERELLDRAVGTGQIAVRDLRGRVHLLPRGARVTDLPGHASVVAVPGMVTDEFVRGLLGRLSGGFKVLTRDPTRVFLDPATYAALWRLCGRVEVARGVRLVALSVVGPPDEPCTRMVVQLARELAPQTALIMVTASDGPS